jgi:hypothetical protein
VALSLSLSLSLGLVATNDREGLLGRGYAAIASKQNIASVEKHLAAMEEEDGNGRMVSRSQKHTELTH